jgi:cytochrome P450
VLSESMRIYPPVYLIGRQAIEDYPAGEYVLPAGSTILISQYAMHHDPRWYPDPYRFDLERWTPEAEAARPKFAYFPFGGGNRMCIGENFAWTEGILVLATLAQRWQPALVNPNPPALQPLITLRPKNGIPMRLEERG